MIAGLLLDVHDDAGCAVLRQMFPERLPELLKSAEVLTEGQRQALPDDMFALILQAPSGERLRKYACHTPAHTALSVEYFLHLGERLGPLAQKTAAANLHTACGWYGLPENETLVKVALGNLLMSGAKALGGKVLGAVKANPIGSAMTAVGALGTAQALGGAVKDTRAALRGVGAAEQAAGGFGRIVGA